MANNAEVFASMASPKVKSMGKFGTPSQAESREMVAPAPKSMEVSAPEVEMTGAGATDILKARGYGLGERLGSGGYVYEVMADDSIKIVKSPKSKGGQIVKAGDEFYDLIKSDIMRVAQDPELHKAGMAKPKGGGAKATGPKAMVEPVPEEMEATYVPPEVTPRETFSPVETEEERYGETLLDLPPGAPLPARGAPTLLERGLSAAGEIGDTAAFGFMELRAMRQFMDAGMSRAAASKAVDEIIRNSGGAGSRKAYAALESVAAPTSRALFGQLGG